VLEKTNTFNEFLAKFYEKIVRKIFNFYIIGNDPQNYSYGLNRDFLNSPPL